MPSFLRKTCRGSTPSLIAGHGERQRAAVPVDAGPSRVRPATARLSPMRRDTSQALTCKRTSSPSGSDSLRAIPSSRLRFARRPGFRSAGSASVRLPPPMSPIRCRAVGPENIDDLARLFGPTGAHDGCWCMWFRLSGKEFSAGSGASNRRRLRARVRSGAPVGVLARKGGEPVGWAAVAPRADLPRLPRSPISKPVHALSAWALTCLFVGKEHGARASRTRWSARRSSTPARAARRRSRPFPGARPERASVRTRPTSASTRFSSRKASSRSPSAPGTAS